MGDPLPPSSVEDEEEEDACPTKNVDQNRSSEQEALDEDEERIRDMIRRALEVSL